MSDTFLDFVDLASGDCWQWTGCKNSTGYGYYRGRGDQSHRMVLAHRVSYERFIGEIPEGYMVLHACDNRCCVNPAHLRIGTHADNMTDRNNRGRAHRPIGEGHPRAKLTRSDVAEIRRLRGVVSQVRLAQKFGVSRSTIRDAQSGRNW